MWILNSKEVRGGLKGEAGDDSVSGDYDVGHVGKTANSNELADPNSKKSYGEQSGGGLVSASCPDELVVSRHGNSAY